MEKLKYFKELELEQRRISIDMKQLFESWILLEREREQYKGGLFWKKSAYNEYLFRSSNSFGDGKSLGVRSEKTEIIFNSFHERKNTLENRAIELKNQIAKLTPYVKAAQLNRVPRIVAKILRAINKNPAVAKQIKIVGTHSLFAYEIEAGIFFNREMLTTQDLDLMWDVRKNIKFVVHGSEKNLLETLKKADRSFELLEPKSFCAVNKEGFRVDFIKPTPKPPWKISPQYLNEDDFWAAEISNLDWLIHSPAFEAVVFDQDGFPLKMICPDPRAFALHKLWVSRQENRSSLKSQRDLVQSEAVAQCVYQYYPNFPFLPENLKQFPFELSQEVLKWPDMF